MQIRDGGVVDNRDDGNQRVVIPCVANLPLIVDIGECGAMLFEPDAVSFIVEYVLGQVKRAGKETAERRRGDAREIAVPMFRRSADAQGPWGIGQTNRSYDLPNPLVCIMRIGND